MAKVMLVLAWALCCVSAAADSGPQRRERGDDSQALVDVVMQQGQIIQQLQAKVASLEAKQAKADQLVAFMVNADGRQTLTNGQRVKFGAPSLNVGSGFDTDTDGFVAPLPGVYVFFFKVTGIQGSVSGGGNDYATFSLKKNGQTIADTETNDQDNEDRASVQVIVTLQVGEAVWAEKVGGNAPGLDGGVLTTLGGFLLRQGVEFE